jgi:hypothetical protein
MKRIRKHVSVVPWYEAPEQAILIVHKGPLNKPENGIRAPVTRVFIEEGVGRGDGPARCQ